MASEYPANAGDPMAMNTETKLSTLSDIQETPVPPHHTPPRIVCRSYSGDWTGWVRSRFLRYIGLDLRHRLERAGREGMHRETKV